MSQCYCRDCQAIDYCHSSKIRYLIEDIIKLEADNTRLRKAVQLALELEQTGLVDFTKYQLTHNKDVERVYITALEEK